MPAASGGGAKRTVEPAVSDLLGLSRGGGGGGYETGSEKLDPKVTFKRQQTS